jgi:hypothetical protein
MLREGQSPVSRRGCRWRCAVRWGCLQARNSDPGEPTAAAMQRMRKLPGGRREKNGWRPWQRCRGPRRLTREIVVTGLCRPSTDIGARHAGALPSLYICDGRAEQCSGSTCAVSIPRETHCRCPEMTLCISCWLSWRSENLAGFIVRRCEVHALHAIEPWSVEAVGCPLFSDHVTMGVSLAAWSGLRGTQDTLQRFRKTSKRAGQPQKRGHGRKAAAAPNCCGCLPLGPACLNPSPRHPALPVQASPWPA